MAHKDPTDPGLLDKVVVCISAGKNATKTAKAIGISKSLFYEWWSKGRAGDPEFVEFLEAIKKGQEYGELDAIAAVKAAWDKDWRAASWWLERTQPERYGLGKDRAAMMEARRSAEESKAQRRETLPEFIRRVGVDVMKREIEAMEREEEDPPEGGELVDP